MHRLSVILFSLVSPMLAGTGAVAALVAGVTDTLPILLSAAAGFVVSVPVSIWLAKRLDA